jgi:hypothetical protein
MVTLSWKFIYGLRRKPPIASRFVGLGLCAREEQSNKKKPFVQKIEPETWEDFFPRKLKS